MDTPTNSQNALAVLAQQRLGQLPSMFRNRQGRLNEDMAGGITAGFAIVSFRGKGWRIKYQGKESDILLAEDGRTPLFYFDVVILKASPHLSKVWYEHGYVEGSIAPPDCWSVDGRKPDPASRKLQNETCAGCKWNAWGSSRSTAGSGKGKDCADSKRLAIVPAEDIENQRYGGPMMLRVPPASLGGLLTYANSLEKIGYPYYSVVTRISFEMNQPFPQLKFEPLEALEEDEGSQVEQLLLRSPIVDRIISAAVDEVQTNGEDTTHVVPVVPRQEPPPVTVAAPSPTLDPEMPEFLRRETVAPTPAKPTATPQGSDQRTQMRAMGLSEAQIDAAIGPEAKPEPVIDPRIAQLKAMGIPDDKIAAVLGLQAKDGPAPPAPNPAQAASAEPPKQRRGRGPGRPKAETAPPASNGAQEPATVAPAPALRAGDLNVAPKPEPAGDLPPGFEDMLDGILKSSAAKQ